MGRWADARKKHENALIWNPQNPQPPPPTPSFEGFEGSERARIRKFSAGDDGAAGGAAQGFEGFETSQSARIRKISAGAPDPAELDERAAMALEGGVPAVYADAFSRLQLQRPAAVDEPAWRQAVDDAARFLDAWGRMAEQFDWSPGDLFDVPRPGGRSGLIWFLRGERARALGPEHAITTAGRVFDRLDRSAWPSVAAWVAAHR